MTRDEATKVFARMVTIWPKTELPDATVTYWLDFLRFQSVAIATAAVDACALEFKWFPSIAEYQTVARRTQVQDRLRTPPRSIDAPRASKQTAAEWIEKCRQTLHNAGRIR